MRLTDVPEKHHEIALAWFKGETIQVEDSTGTWWEFAKDYEPLFLENSVYRVKPQKAIKVRDGFVSTEDKVWWHCADGLELVLVDDHIWNIEDYPRLYSINKPEYRKVTRYIYEYDPDF